MCIFTDTVHSFLKIKLGYIEKLLKEGFIGKVNSKSVLTTV